VGRAFGERRWIDVDDPALLDLQGANLLLIGAHEGDLAESMGIELPRRSEAVARTGVFRTLGIVEDESSLAPLIDGVFPDTELTDGQALLVTPEAQAVSREAALAKRVGRFRCEICREGFATRSAFARHMDTSHPPRAPSAADVALALKGLDLPADRDGIVAHAVAAGTDDEVVDLLRRLPRRTYRTAADVAKGFGQQKRGRARR
jgi:hypothetical protein